MSNPFERVGFTRSAGGRGRGGGNFGGVGSAAAP